MRRAAFAAAFLGLIGSALGRGRRIPRHPGVDYATDLAEATVKGFGPFPYQVDGDYLGEVTTLRFRHEPDVLSLVQP
jgi:diacylglycerol kinase family enzyme